MLSQRLIIQLQMLAIEQHISTLDVRVSSLSCPLYISLLFNIKVFFTVKSIDLQLNLAAVLTAAQPHAVPSNAFSESSNNLPTALAMERSK
jgi:hypothetical protein